MIWIKNSNSETSELKRLEEDELKVAEEEKKVVETYKPSIAGHLVPNFTDTGTTQSRNVKIFKLQKIVCAKIQLHLLSK